MNLLFRILRAFLAEGRFQQPVRHIGEYEQPADHASQPPPPITVRSVLEVPEAIVDAYKASQEKQGTRDFVDRIRLGVEALVLFAIIVGFWFNWKQLRLTDGALEVTRQASVTATRQADIASRQLEATDRPWLKVVSVRPRALDFMPLNAAEPAAGQLVTLNVWIDLENIGRSVATQINANVELHLTNLSPSPALSDDMRAISEESCKPTNPAIAGRNAITLFPNDKTSLAYAVGRNIGPTNMAWRDTTKGRTAFLMPYLVGCIDYRFGTSATPHSTGFMFAVTGIDRKRLMPLGLSLIGPQILLERDAWYDKAK